MAKNNDYNRVSVLVVGAGPAGLACAIQLKTKKPEIDVCVIDKSPEPGNHNLSGAVLEKDALHRLLDSAVEGWKDSDTAKDVLGKKVKKDNVMFFLGRKMSFNIFFMIKLAKKLGLNFGQMIHKGDYIVSISKLTKWLVQIAKDVGVEVLPGFAAADIILDESAERSVGVRLVDQGLDREGGKLPNFVEGDCLLYTSPSPRD